MQLNRVPSQLHLNRIKLSLTPRQMHTYGGVVVRALSKPLLCEAANINQSLAGGPGFEPRLPGPEPGVLPLNYPPRNLKDHTDFLWKGKRLAKSQILFVAKLPQNDYL